MSVADGCGVPVFNFCIGGVNNIKNIKYKKKLLKFKSKLCMQVDFLHLTCLKDKQMLVFILYWTYCAPGKSSSVSAVTF